MGKANERKKKNEHKIDTIKSFDSVANNSSNVAASLRRATEGYRSEGDGEPKQSFSFSSNDTCESNGKGGANRFRSFGRTLKHRRKTNFVDISSQIDSLRDEFSRVKSSSKVDIEELMKIIGKYDSSITKLEEHR